MTFTESNIIEQMTLDAAANLGGAPCPARWAIRAKVAGSIEPVTQ